MGRAYPCFHPFSPGHRWQGLLRYNARRGGNGELRVISFEFRGVDSRSEIREAAIFLLRRSRTARQNRNSAAGGTFPLSSKLSTLNFLNKKTLILSRTRVSCFHLISSGHRWRGSLPVWLYRCAVTGVSRAAYWHRLLLTQALECTSTGSALSALTCADSLEGNDPVYSFLHRFVFRIMITIPLSYSHVNLFPYSL